MFYAEIVDPEATYFDNDGILRRDDRVVKFYTKAERDKAVDDFNDDIGERREKGKSLLGNREPEFMRAVKATDITQKVREEALLG